MSMKIRLLVFLLGAVGLISIGVVMTKIHGGPKEAYRSIREIDLVGPKDSNDHIMKDIRSLTRGFGRDDQPDYTPDALVPFTEKQIKLLADFDAWLVKNKSDMVQFYNTEGLGNYSRIYEDFDHTTPYQTDGGRILQKLLARDAARAFRENDLALGKLRLRQGLTLVRIMVRNGDIPSFIQGTSQMQVLLAVMIKEAPPEVLDQELIGLIPDRDYLRRGYLSALYIEALKNDSLIQSKLSSFIVNKDRMRHNVHQEFVFHQDRLNQPLIQRLDMNSYLEPLPEFETAFMEMSQAVKLYKTTDPRYQLAVMASDVSLIHLDLKRNGIEITKENVVSKASELHVMDIYSDKPYIFDDEGRLTKPRNIAPDIISNFALRAATKVYFAFP